MLSYGVVVSSTGFVAPMVSLWRYTHQDTGNLFLICILAIAFASPPWGYLAHKFGAVKSIIVAAILGAFGFILLGPLPALPLGMGIFGVSVSGELMAAIVYSISEACDSVFVSGIWMTMDAAGNLIGANTYYLVEAIGFHQLIMFMVILYLVQLILLIGVLVKEWRDKKKDVDTILQPMG